MPVTQPQALLRRAQRALRANELWSVSGRDGDLDVSAGRHGSTQWMGWGAAGEIPQVLIVGDFLLARGAWAWVAALAHAPREDVQAALAGRWLRRPLKRALREDPDALPAVKLLQSLDRADAPELVDHLDVAGHTCARIRITDTWTSIGETGTLLATTRSRVWTVRLHDAALLSAVNDHDGSGWTFQYGAAQVPVVVDDRDQIDEAELIALVSPARRPRRARLLTVSPTSVDVFRVSEDDPEDETPWIVQATGLAGALRLASHVEAEGPVLAALTAVDPRLPERIAFDSEHEALVIRTESETDARVIAGVIAALAQ